jgi:RNA polymerase sigma factor (TIGR02999 family)
MPRPRPDPPESRPPGPAPAGGVDAHFEAAYRELLRLARSHLRSERPDHTLETAALVHEAYLKLAGRSEVGGAWRDRSLFLASASRAMRRILVDHARRRSREKRGGGAHRPEDAAGHRRPGGG